MMMMWWQNENRYFQSTKATIFVCLLRIYCLLFCRQTMMIVTRIQQTAQSENFLQSVKYCRSSSYFFFSISLPQFVNNSEKKSRFFFFDLWNVRLLSVCYFLLIAMLMLLLLGAIVKLFLRHWNSANLDKFEKMSFIQKKNTFFTFQHEIEQIVSMQNHIKK